MRPTCAACDRPLRVCLCAELPSEPIHTGTKIVVLQHPHETRHKLATVPVLTRCLSNCEVIVGRRLHLGTSKLLDACASSFMVSSPHEDGLGSQCMSCGQRKLVLLLFPTSDASELRSWLSCRRTFRKPDRAYESENIENSELVSTTQEVRRELCSDGVSSHIILLVVDGTWQHAKEMVKASMPFLSRFVEQVCLPHDITREGLGMGDSESIIRKEPFAGCVSTMEAVARSLAILEPNGLHIEQTLLSVLRRIVHLQASHFIPMKPRARR